MAMAVKPIPDGYHTVTPYLIVIGAGGLIEFVKQAFGATERMRTPGPNSAVMHAEIQLGDSVIMMADAPDQARVKTAMIHLYVTDVDADYKHALQAGGESIREPTDQTYGDRSAAVKDRWGNEWWLATHIKDVAPA
jgi:PhnB protein